MNTRTPMAIAAVLAAVLALSACVAEPDAVPSSPSATSTSGAASPSPTPEVEDSITVDDFTGAPRIGDTDSPVAFGPAKSITITLPKDMYAPADEDPHDPFVALDYAEVGMIESFTLEPEPDIDLGDDVCAVRAELTWMPGAVARAKEDTGGLVGQLTEADLVQTAVRNATGVVGSLDFASLATERSGLTSADLLSGDEFDAIEISAGYEEVVPSSSPQLALLSDDRDSVLFGVGCTEDELGGHVRFLARDSFTQLAEERAGAEVAMKDGNLTLVLHQIENLTLNADREWIVFSH